MASCWSNLFSVLLIASVTFILLDVNRHDNFNRTLTAKYLRNVGLKPYVDKAIVAISSSDVYKHHISPSWLSLVRQVRKYATLSQAYTSKHVNNVAVFLKKHSTSLHEYVDNVLVPCVKKHGLKYYNLVNKYLSMCVNMVADNLLKFSNWLNSNIFSNPNVNAFSKVLVELVTETQKVAINSYEWVAGQVGKIVA